MKFRDIVHTQTEATVPATIRAAETVTQPSSKLPSQKPPLEVIEKHRHTVLDWVRTHPNRWITYKELAKKVGTTDASTRGLVRTLVKYGYLIEVEVDYHYGRKFAIGEEYTEPLVEARMTVMMQYKEKPYLMNLLVWISQHPGEPVFVQSDLARAIKTDPRRVIKELEHRGYITKEVYNHHKGVSFNLTTAGRDYMAQKLAKPDLDRGDYKNSDVVIRKFDTPAIPKEPIKIPAPEPVVKQTIEVPDYMPKPEPVSAFVKRAEEALGTKLPTSRGDYWEFLKELTAKHKFSDEHLGIAVRTLKYYEAWDNKTDY